MNYIIPKILLSEITEINDSNYNKAVPCNVTDEIIIIDVPNDWAEHLAFVNKHNLKPYEVPTNIS